MRWLAYFMSWLANHRPTPVKQLGPGKPDPEPVDTDQLTVNFHISEFKTRDGTPVPDKYRDNAQLLADNLQVLRDEIKKPIKLISAYRHPAYNKKVGGAKSSQHLTASAADMVVKGMSAKRVADKVSQLIKDGKMKKGGLGRYPHFTHYDVRPKNARWGSNKKK